MAKRTAARIGSNAVRTKATIGGDAFRSGQSDPARDVVDRASNDSFPASDAPAWINRDEPTASDGGAVDNMRGTRGEIRSPEEAMTQTISRAPDTRRPEIRVTETDLNNLKHLLSIHGTRWSWRAVEFLVRELLRAEIVDGGSVPANVVTMGSRVEYREQGQSSSQVVTLSYPGEREFFDDAISILTPVGAALIGLTAGQSICYAGPDGRPVTIKILRVMSQPEANHRMRFKPTPRAMPAHAMATLRDR
jgi:regulator of nucleoside diphosphate kinase